MSKLSLLLPIRAMQVVNQLSQVVIGCLQHLHLPHIHQVANFSPGWSLLEDRTVTWSLFTQVGLSSSISPSIRNRSQSFKDWLRVKPMAKEHTQHSMPQAHLKALRWVGGICRLVIERLLILLQVLLLPLRWPGWLLKIFGIRTLQALLPSAHPREARTSHPRVRVVWRAPFGSLSTENQIVLLFQSMARYSHQWQRQRQQMLATQSKLLESQEGPYPLLTSFLSQLGFTAPSSKVLRGYRMQVGNAALLCQWTVLMGLMKHQAMQGLFVATSCLPRITGTSCSLCNCYGSNRTCSSVLLNKIEFGTSCCTNLTHQILGLPGSLHIF